MDKPKVITLCGSTRFPQAFDLVNMHYSMNGNVVISLGCFGHADDPAGAKFLTSDGDEATPEKRALDALHFRKIDLSDEIVVINVGNYIGSSTRREIEYAKSQGKPVKFLFQETDLDEVFSLANHLRRQRAFSLKTFGPGQRRKGVVDHIRKELDEIEADPEGKGELEWIDVIILGFDGALRDDPDRPVEEIIARMVAKQTKNEGRNWPDWRTADPDKAIEHDRSGEQEAKLHGSALPIATEDPQNGDDMDRPRYSSLLMKLELDRVREQARRDLMDELSGTCVVSPQNKFNVGDQVEKFTGDYRARGEVRGIFAMKQGALRYVVEHEVAGGAGSFCHIYSEGQLRLLEQEASDAG